MSRTSTLIKYLTRLGTGSLRDFSDKEITE